MVIRGRGVVGEADGFGNVAGFFCAAAKSEESEGTFGVDVVGEVGGEWNWEDRSSSWLRRRGSWEDMALAGEGQCTGSGRRRGWTCSSGTSATCDSRDSMPERSWSSEREIWPSC